jgi:hypothetical protein
MSDLNPAKLHTSFTTPTSATGPLHPRCYTLTHSDRTGDMFLAVADEYDQKQISGWYTRLMRDEVLATWQYDGDQASLHVHLHVSGGIVLGSGAWRASLFRHHLRQVLEAFRYGDRQLVQHHPALDQSPIHVHFHARQEELNLIESWGVFGDYTLNLSEQN